MSGKRGRKCSMRNCDSYQHTHKHLSFFRFPKDMERCKIWIERSGRPDLLDKVNVHEERVCERHFASNMFLNDYRNRLHASAVPSSTPIIDLHQLPDYSKAIDLSLALANETKLMKRAEMLYKTHSLASDLTITPSNGYRTPNGSHANHTSPSINTSSAMQPMNLSMVTVNAVTPTPVTSVTPQPPQSANAPNAGYKRPRQIFTLQQEDQLAAYVRDTATYYSGLSSKEVRIMAFVYGVCNQVEMPMGWRESHEASFDWCIGFVKRNKLAPMVFQGLSYKNNNIKSQPMQLPKLPSINANGSPHGKDEMRLANETNATTNGDGNGAAMSIEIDD